MTPVAKSANRQPQAVIMPHTALVAALRLWFLYRDQALWTFVGGENQDDPLEQIVIGDEFSAQVLEVNDAYRRALKLAERIAADSERKVATVMREAIDELLLTERPRFLLTVDHIPGTF
jgi:hypothetical protein